MITRRSQVRFSGSQKIFRGSQGIPGAFQVFPAVYRGFQGRFRCTEFKESQGRFRGSWWFPGGIVLLNSLGTPCNLIAALQGPGNVPHASDMTGNALDTT